MPEQYAPLREDEFQFTLRVDLGPNASLDRIAECTNAVRDLIDLGDRWAIVLAHEAAARALIAELNAGDYASLEPLAKVLAPADDKRTGLSVAAVRERHGYEHAESLVEIPAVLAMYADAALPDLLRPAVRAREVSYRNPLEWILFGGGFAVYATVQALRVARDWKSRKRIGDAAATAAEAQARAEVARADVLEHLAGEVTSGRLQVAPSELGKLMTPTDLKGMSALAGAETTLALPSGLSKVFGEADGDEK
jgi:hypothetical protein